MIRTRRAPLVLNCRNAPNRFPALYRFTIWSIPLPRKAIQEAYEAQRFARAQQRSQSHRQTRKGHPHRPRVSRRALAISACRYARAGRSAEARAEFQKALDIGPPVAPIYADLALISAGLGQITARPRRSPAKPWNWTPPTAWRKRVLRIRFRTLIQR